MGGLELSLTSFEVVLKFLKSLKEVFKLSWISPQVAFELSLFSLYLIYVYPLFKSLRVVLKLSLRIFDVVFEVVLS